jgi:Mrp family chromosome partitioning ATPase
MGIIAQDRGLKTRALNEHDASISNTAQQVNALGAVDFADEVEPSPREQDHLRVLSEIRHEITSLCPKYVEFVHLIRRYTSTHLSSPGPKVIGVVSANGAEGRTTVALGLASALSEIHGGVVFVEAENSGGDTLQAQLAQPESLGLSGFLSNEVSLEHGLEPTAKNGLWLLPAGRFQNELTGLEAIAGIRSLLIGLREKFDAVVIDLPPFLLSEGSPALVSELDGVILVISAGQTTMSEVENTVRLCGTVPLKGVFLNRAVYKTPQWLASLLGAG